MRCDVMNNRCCTYHPPNSSCSVCGQFCIICLFTCKGCKPNSHYEECGTACPRICHEEKPFACTEDCRQGCFCDEGYVRNSSDATLWSCVPEEYCVGKEGPVSTCWKLQRQTVWAPHTPSGLHLLFSIVDSYERAHCPAAGPESTMKNTIMFRKR